MRRLLFLATSALALAAFRCEAASADGDAPRPVAKEAVKEAEAPRAAARKACLSAAETREQIKAAHLREPYAALKSAAQHFKAEALSAKLCRIEDQFVYEIALLHKDGKYFHAHVDAVTGKLVDFKRVGPAKP